MLNASLHMMAAVVLMGYVIFGALGWFPAVPDAARTDVFRRSHWLTWSCLAVLAATGILMLPKWHVTWDDIASGQLLADRFGKMLALKTAAILALIGGFLFVKPTQRHLWRLQFLVGLGVVLISIFVVR